MDRRQIILVLAFTLAGIAIGDCVAMLLHKPKDERGYVPLDHSLLAATFGGFVGLVVGLRISSSAVRNRKALARATVVAAIVLSGAVGAQFGWLVGDSTTDRVRVKGLLIGALSGCLFGTALGITQYNDDGYSKTGENEKKTLD